MTPINVFEHSPDTPLQPGEVDGMAEFLDELDEPTSTTWDAEVEPPPHAGIEPEIIARWNKPEKDEQAK